MQSALILTLVRLNAISKGSVFLRAGASGLFKRYPVFLGMAALSLFLSIVGFNGHYHPYAEYWKALAWPRAGLDAAAGIEAFWILAGHFRGMKNFGWGLLVVIFAISALASAPTALIHVDRNLTFRGPAVTEKYIFFWMLCTLIFSRVFFRQFPQFPIRPNAKRHLVALTLMGAASFIGLTIELQGAHYAGGLVLAAGANLAYGYWALLMTRQGEELPFAPPPPKSRADFDEAERGYKESVDRIKQSGSRGWWRVFGW